MSTSAFAASLPGGFKVGEHVLVPADNSGRMLSATITAYDEEINSFVVKYDETMTYREAHLFGDISGDSFSAEQIRKIDAE
jgi:hypothetical protein